MAQDEHGISLTLDQDMLLVLHDIVVRLTDAPESYGLGPAETEALDRLELMFERRGDLLFSAEQPSLLAAARLALTPPPDEQRGG